MSKPIRFTTRLGPNFLWHMLAVGKIGYDSDYAERYRHTVGEADLDELRRHRELLWFLGGDGGELAAFFGTFAGWLHIEFKEEFANYFVALEAVLAERSFAPLIERFQGVEWNDAMVGPSVELWEFPEDTASLREAVKRLAAVYLRAHDRYVAEVWPEAEKATAPRAAELNRLFQVKDYIALWEDCLKLPFRAPEYEIVVCYANKNGPDYNSLGYSGNLIYYDKPFDRTWQFISHEIGTHLLIDLMVSFQRERDGRYDWGKLYGAYEVMAMFFNRRLLRLDSLAYDLAQFNDRELLAFYEETYEAGMSPGELLRGAGERFCRGEDVRGE